jgi:hypothetical protein
MTHPITLTLLQQYIADPAPTVAAAYITQAASYGPDVHNDVIRLIARYLQLTGDGANPALLSLDLDALLAALDDDD